MTLSRPLRAGLAAVLLAAAITVISAVFASAAGAASRDCAARRGTLDTTPLGRVWHRGGVLFGCTTVYGHRPRTVRLGPWGPFSRVAFDGVNVAWTARRTVGGQRVDRIWAANIDSRTRWLRGAKLLPAREVLVRAVLLRDQAVAWITQTSDVVLALRSPQDDPVAIGTVPRAVRPRERFLVVGSWPAVASRALAATTKLAELPGEGDECGAVNPYELTVQPDPAGPRIGVRWAGYWQSTNCS